MLPEFFWLFVKALGYEFLPGFLSYLMIYPLREKLMSLTGLSSHYIQFLVLVVMSWGWHILFPFFMLKFREKLTFRQSLRFLGFGKLDFKGVILVFPIITLVFTLLSLPYMKYVCPSVPYGLLSFCGSFILLRSP